MRPQQATASVVANTSAASTAGTAASAARRPEAASMNCRSQVPGSISGGFKPALSPTSTAWAYPIGSPRSAVTIRHSADALMRASAISASALARLPKPARALASRSQRRIRKPSCSVTGRNPIGPDMGAASIVAINAGSDAGW